MTDKLNDTERFKLNQFLAAPTGKIVMASTAEHPLFKNKVILVIGIEYEDDILVGVGSTIAFLPKDLT